MSRLIKHLFRGHKARAARGRKKQPIRLALETFEDRLVPTIAFPFNPAFGPETVTPGSEHALSDDPVHLIFLGSEWGSDQSPAASAIKTAADQVLNSTYFDRLDQYGVTGAPHLDSSAFDNNDFGFGGGTGTFTPDNIQDTVSNATHNGLPRADAGVADINRRIYVVVTPPGASDATESTSVYG